MNDVHTPRLELWMDPTTRTQHLSQLDNTIFGKKNISRNHLHYLASNTRSLPELYKIIQQKMTQNNFINYSISEQTQLQLQESFQTLHRAIKEYKEKQEVEILYCLVDKLEDFYG